MRQLDTTWFRGYFWHGGTQGSPIYLAFGCWKHGIHQFGLQVWLVPAIGGAWGTEKLPETSNDTGQVHHVHLIFNHHFLLYLCLQSFICPCFEGWMRRRCPSPPSQWTAVGGEGAARRLDKMLLTDRLVEVHEGPVRLGRGDVVLTFYWCYILKFLHHVEISCCCIW